MFGFFRNKTTNSPLRKWIKKSVKNRSNKDNLRIYFESIIYSISLFNNKTSKEKGDLTNEYKGDSALFEIGAFILFQVDLWFHKNQKSENKEMIMNLIIPEFLKVFNGYLSVKNIDQIFQSRFDIYGTIVNEHKSEYLPIAIEYLEEFVFRTRNNSSPQIVLMEKYFTSNFNTLEVFTLKSLISTYLQSFLPIIFDIAQKMDEYADLVKEEIKLERGMN